MTATNLSNCIVGTFPLSQQQRRIWKLGATLPEYCSQCAVLLEGVIPIESARAALLQVMQREEVLRTTFRNTETGVEQAIVDMLEPTWEMITLDEFRAESLPKLFRAQRAAPFNFEHGPLLRAMLALTPGNRSLLLLTIPSICADAVSLWHLLQRLGNVAAVSASGEQPRYVEFAAWEDETVQTQGKKSLLGRSYWNRQNLASMLAPALSGLRNARGAGAPSERQCWKAKVETSLARRLQQNADELHVAVDDILRSAWATLLMRLTGECPLLLGDVADGRKYQEITEALGPYARCLPLRLQLNGRESFRENVAHVREVRNTAVDWQEYAVLPDGMALPCGFEWNDWTAPVRSFGLQGKFLGQYSCVDKFQLKLSALRLPEELRLEIEWEPAQFDSGAILRLGAQYLNLLEAVLESIDQPLMDLPLITPSEKEEILLRFNKTDTVFADYAGVHELIQKQALLAPASPAVIFDGNMLSYAELDFRANQVARQLLAARIMPEQPVGVLLKRSERTLIAFLGILKAGGAFVPLDAAHSQERIMMQLQEGKVTHVLTESSLAHMLVEASKIKTMLLDESQQFAGSTPTVRILREQLAYVLFTSGSTGRPKGVQIEHRALLNYVLAAEKRLGLSGRNTFAMVSTFTADLANTAIYGALASGGCLHVIPAETASDPELLRRYLKIHRVDCMKIVPSHINALMCSNQCEELLPGKLLVLGGETASWPLIEKIRQVKPQCRIVNHYGPTEATVGVLTCTITPELCLQPESLTVPIGSPLSNCRAYLLDHEMRPVPWGTAGELYIGGSGLARGYLGRPELTAENFVPDPFGDSGERLYRTGDMGRLTNSRMIEFLGRVDDQVKIHGYRVELGEIEAAFLSHAEISQAAVLFSEKETGEKHLAAYVVGRGQTCPTVQELRIFILSKLPPYMLPTTIVVLKAMPLNANGKIDRAALRKLAPLESSRAPSTAPRNQREEIIASIFREVLNIENPGIHDNFFDLGGDSILAIQVVSKANNRGLSLSPRQIFEAQTIAELAAVQGGAVAASDQGEISGPVVLSPIQRWFFEQQFTALHHWNQSMMLEVSSRLSISLLETAVAHLVAHHEVLRSLFEQREGVWCQRISPVSEYPGCFRRIDLSHLAAAEAAEVREGHIAGIQAELDLAQGPVMRFVMFDHGPATSSWLLIASHHLVVDGVSWRILMEDLETACTQLLNDEPISLPLKTHSWPVWAAKLTELANSDALADESDYWMRLAALPAQTLPRDANGPNTVASADTISKSLEPEPTRILLQELPERYSSQINDVLVTALARAFARITKNPWLLLDMEGHGREPIFPDIDVSRTVGWFTTHYPVPLKLSTGSKQPHESLEQVKQELRAVPQNGIGYGLLRYLRNDDLYCKELAKLRDREVKFNYLGKVESAKNGNSLFTVLSESTGPQRDEFSTRTHLIDINAIVIAGQFHVRWSYSRNVHRRVTVQRLADAFIEELNVLITGSDSGCRPPADFPLARLNRRRLEKIVSTVEARKVGDNEKRLEIADIYPLSPLQESLLAHSLASPDSRVGFEQKRMHIEGDLDLEAFRRTWQEIVDHYAIFRTSFVADGQGGFLQTVVRSVDLPIETYDWSGAASEEQQTRMEAYIHADRARGFDSGCAPLMRLTVIQLGQGKNELIWSYHHLLLDAWSRNLVLKEAFTLYGRFRRGEVARASSSLPYRDYIEWLGRQDEASAEIFWRDLLHGVRRPTMLSSSSRFGGQSATARDYHTLTVSLVEDDSTALHQFARENRLTLNTLVQGAWCLLLGYISGTRDVVYGTTVSGRPPGLSGSESMLGMFINNLPVKVNLPPSEHPRQWLTKLQQLLLAIRDYEWVSPQKMMQWSEVQGGQPLFTSLLIFQNYPVEDTAIYRKQSELDIYQVSSRMETNYPLTLVVGPFQPLTIRLIYDSRFLRGSTVAQWGDSLIALLRGFVASPDIPLAHIPLLTPTGEQRIRPFNGEATIPDEGVFVGKRVEMLAQTSPDKIAIQSEMQEISWSQLHRRSCAVAARLQEAGATPGNVIALVGAKGIEAAISILGVWKAGCAVVIDDRLGGERATEDCLRQSMATHMLIFGDEISSVAGWNGVMVRITADEERGSVSPQAPSEGDMLAWVHQRSGSGLWNTVTHSEMALRATGLRKMLGDPKAHKLFITGPLAIASLQLAEALAVGVPAVFVPAEISMTDRSLRAALEKSQADVMRAPEPVWSALIEAGWHGRPNFTAVCQTVIPSKWLRKNLALRGTLCFKTYALEGVSFELTVEPMKASDSPNNLGSPSGAEMFVLSEGLKPMPVGMYGEIYVSSGVMGWGYLNSPGATAANLLPNPFSKRPGMRLHRTGDLGRWNEDGTLEFGGKVEGYPAVNAETLTATSVEAGLLSHPELRGAAVTRWTNPAGEEQLVAYIQADPKALPDVESLCETARVSLPRHLLPQLFVRLDQLPADSDGRCRRDLLPNPGEPGLTVDHVYVPPSDLIELRIKQIWENLFNIRPIGLREHFFELGGHSLLAIRLMTEIERVFDRKLPISLLLQGGTIEYLARVIREGSRPVEWSPLVQLQPCGERPPLFCIHPMGGEVFCYLDLAHYLGADQPLYGLQSRGWGGGGLEEQTVEEMASTYLAAIREQQSHGPYFLAGWSFGGLVALEIAQQLTACGEAVAMLGVMDTNLRLHIETRVRAGQDAPTEPQLDWPNIILMFARAGAEIPEEELRKFDRVEDQVAYAIQQGVLPPGLTVENAMCYVRASTINNRVKNKYVPRPYPGNVTLFRAIRGHVLNCPDPSLGWQAMALGGLEIADVPGEHGVMVEIPHVVELARKVRESLDHAIRNGHTAGSVFP